MFGNIKMFGDLLRLNFHLELATLAHFITITVSITPENIRKPEVF